MIVVSQPCHCPICTSSKERAKKQKNKQTKNKQTNKQTNKQKRASKNHRGGNKEHPAHPSHAVTAGTSPAATKRKAGQVKADLNEMEEVAVLEPFKTAMWWCRNPLKQQCGGGVGILKTAMW